MTREILDEREFELINIIGADLGSNQRDLSRLMDLSLGMINMLMRRLISKGYIRIKQLNKRKVEYILTPKGFAEKLRKSVKYTLKTVNSLGLINNRLREVLTKLVQDGEKNFTILGDSDFARLVEITFKEISVDGLKLSHIRDVPSHSVEGTLLICKEIFEVDLERFKDHSFNLVEELAKDYAGTSPKFFHLVENE